MIPSTLLKTQVHFDGTLRFAYFIVVAERVRPTSCISLALTHPKMVRSTLPQYVSQAAPTGKMLGI